MGRPDLMAMAQQERGALLELLRTLDEDQFTAPSLCAGWTVRDVAVHVISYDDLSTAGLAGTFLRGGLRVDAINRRTLDRHAGRSPAEVIDLVAHCQRPRGLTAGFKGGIALTDGTIHHQDIRRALAMPRPIPPEQLKAVLSFALTAPTLPARRHARGLRLTATDLDWASGTGAEVNGPAEALLMAMAGRPHSLADLDGPGLPELRQRITT